MKIIDKTPLHDEKGQLSLIGQIQGRLKYGLSWPAELEAQKQVIAQLDRVLEKSFVLIRNFTLPNSEIIIPIILVGVGGITVIHVTTVKGQIEAKGDQWIIDGKPAPINLLNRVSRYARAVEVYMERQGMSLQNSSVEPVLIAANPGAHIESTRPSVRVVMSDAIRQFASSLLQASPVFRSDLVFSMSERIVDPHSMPPAISPEAAQEPAARARAIFNASEQSDSMENSDLGFSFDENAEGTQNAPRPVRNGQAGRPRRAQAPQKRKILGMTTAQLSILAVLLLCQICIVIGAGLFLLNQ